MSDKTIKLYRFEKFEDKRIETLLNNQIWLSAADGFNDLSDCRLPGTYSSEVSQPELVAVSKAAVLLREADEDAKLLTDDVFDSLLYLWNNRGDRFSSQEIDINGGLRRGRATNKTKNSLLNAVKICCFFSGDIEEPLMWAHYADNHKGFCVEYEYTPQEDSRILQVNYASQIAPLSVRELLLCPQESLTRLYTTKSIHWSYEKEFRYVELDTATSESVSQGRAVKLPSYLLPKRIIYGDRACAKRVKQLKERTDMRVLAMKKYRCSLNE